MSRIIIYPYSMKSQSAHRLREALPNSLLVRENGKYRPRQGDIVFNWGNSHRPANFPIHFNSHIRVARACNKLETFDTLQVYGMEEVLPPFATTIEVAQRWLRVPLRDNMVNAVVCRTQLNAHSGRGIILAKTPEELVPAPLYVRYIPKLYEFRVHSSHRGTNFVQVKLRRNGAREEANYSQYIRSHHHGWVFTPNLPNEFQPYTELYQQLYRLGQSAIFAMCLDYGAVDIGWHPEFGFRVYEVNTAPGIEESTVNYYTQLFTELSA